jgi:hypothetical protein
MIGIEVVGKIRAIYCHFDGYLDGVGKMLYNHYTTEEKVHQLMDLGNLSSLDKEIGTKHNFDAAPTDECNFYGRDRGDEDQEADEYWSVYEILIEDGAEFVYVMKDGVWYVGKDMVPLAQLLQPEYVAV